MQAQLTLNVDLAPIGGSEVTATGLLEIERGCDPDILIVDFDEIGATPRSAILGILPQELAQSLVVSGRTALGEVFSATIHLQNSVTTSDSGALRATFILQDHSISPQNQTRAVAEWRFPLFNWAAHICDICTSYNANRSSRLDRIQFNIERRNWTIIDHTVGNRDELKKSDHNHPLRTATLVTPALHNDHNDTVKNAADIVCLLLSFALGRRVNWVAAVGYSAENEEIESSVSSRIIEPYNSRGICSIDNFDSGVIRDFIEPAYLAFVEDTHWFRLSLGYYIGTKCRQFVDVRTMILYMLLDRIAEKVLPGNWGPRFTDQLDSILSSSFVSEVTALFADAIPNWTSVNTDGMLGIIRQWNRSPSYPDKIQQACAALDLPPPSRKLLAQRHKALHTGRFDNNQMDIRETWLRVDWIVLSMMLRLLGYSGPVFHPIVGAHPLPFMDSISRLAEQGGVYEE